MQNRLTKYFKFSIYGKTITFNSDYCLCEPIVEKIDSGFITNEETVVLYKVVGGQMTHDDICEIGDTIVPRSTGTLVSIANHPLYLLHKDNILAKL